MFKIEHDLIETEDTTVKSKKEIKKNPKSSPKININTIGSTRSKMKAYFLTIAMTLASIIFLFPIALVLMNSFKSKLYISDAPFVMPTSETFVGLLNYTEGIAKTGLLLAAGRSFFITVSSVVVIVLCTSMAAWWIVRVKNTFASICYYMFVFAMVVPFQMVMYTLSKVADMMQLGNIFGIVFVYLGFGAGLSVFMFAGFIKSIPLSLEEAAMIDGCNPIQIFFKIVLPILKPTVITVAVLNAMWIWNDYLLPTLVLDSDKPTIPMAVQYLKGGYGSVDMGAMMAMLVLAIAPIVVFYISCQKYIIQGVAAGAVKG